MGNAKLFKNYHFEPPVVNADMVKQNPHRCSWQPFT